MSVFLLLLLVAIGNGQQDSLGPCDPLDPYLCMLPFPNNFWLRPNQTTGKLNLQFSITTFPIDRFGTPIDPVKGGWNDLDGFSPSMPMITYWPDLSLDGVPEYWHMNDSLNPDVPTVLLDTVTGQRLPHFGELDMLSNNTNQHLFMMWASTALVNGRRYIVGMRNLKNTAGQLVKPSKAFLELRDNIFSLDPDVYLRRALFDDIFNQLNAVGWQRNTLQLAWDFTVGTTESITSKMLFIRNDGMQRITLTGGVRYDVYSNKANPSQYIARELQVRIQVPNYLTTNHPGSYYVLNASGTPVFQGFEPADVTVLIPNILANGTIKTGMILQYGHGLFGSRKEAQSGYLEAEADRYGYVLISSDWIGLSEYDIPTVADMLKNDLTGFKIIPDRCSQGVLRAAVLGRLLQQANFQNDKAMTFNGVPVLGPTSPIYYFGNSEGGILGAVYMGVTTQITRGVLGVGGGPYAMLLPRSHDFEYEWLIFLDRYPNPLARMGCIAAIQLLWDRAEPGGYMSHITTNPLPNTPQHQILMQHALGDKQVTYVGAYILGRALGATMWESTVTEPGEDLFGFPFIPDDQIAYGAHQATWDFPGVPPVPQVNTPPPADAPDTHEYVRRQTDAQQMMYTFFTTGQIVNTCGGYCHGYIP
jgi:hypothetical protein